MKHSYILKRIKLDHFVILTDGPICINDWVMDKHGMIYQQLTDKIFPNFTGIQKITHSTKPLEDKCSSCGDVGCHICLDTKNYKHLSLSEVNKLIGTLNNKKVSSKNILYWLKNRFTKDAPLSYIISEFEKGDYLRFEKTEWLVEINNKDNIKLK